MPGDIKLVGWATYLLAMHLTWVWSPSGLASGPIETPPSPQKERERESPIVAFPFLGISIEFISVIAFSISGFCFAAVCWVRVVASDALAF